MCQRLSVNKQSLKPSRDSSSIRFVPAAPSGIIRSIAASRELLMRLGKNVNEQDVDAERTETYFSPRAFSNKERTVPRTRSSSDMSFAA